MIYQKEWKSQSTKVGLTTEGLLTETM